MEALKLEHDVALMRKALLLFAETVLRPLVRVLLRHSLSYAEFNQIARKLFVDTVMKEAEFRLPRRRKQYKARVALLTGLCRKEVCRLLEMPRPSENPALESGNRAQRVLSAWLADPRYTDAQGNPVPLPFRAPQGRRSFYELATEFSGDIPPRAILDELRRTGVCSTGDDDHIEILNSDYVVRVFDVEIMTAAAMRGAAALAKIDLALSPPELAGRSPEPALISSH